jgi:hypothetical protein
MARVKVLGVVERRGQSAEGERTLVDITVEAVDGKAVMAALKVGDEIDLAHAVEHGKGSGKR